MHTIFSKAFEEGSLVAYCYLIGCALALVKTSEVPTFMSEVGAAYKKAMGYEATFFESFAEDGVHETTKA